MGWRTVRHGTGLSVPDLRRTGIGAQPEAVKIVHRGRRGGKMAEINRMLARESASTPAGGGFLYATPDGTWDCQRHATGWTITRVTIPKGVIGVGWDHYIETDWIFE